MNFFDVSFEESLDEQLVNAILDVGRDIRRLFEGKESQSRILMILRLQGAVTVFCQALFPKKSVRIPCF